MCIFNKLHLHRWRETVFFSCIFSIPKNELQLTHCPTENLHNQSRVIFHLYVRTGLFLLSNFAPLLLNKLFSPFYSAILKPNFHLRFSQTQLLGEIKPLSSHHVLLACKLSFQALELFDGKDGAHALWFLVGPICFVAVWEESSCGVNREKQLKKCNQWKWFLRGRERKYPINYYNSISGVIWSLF